MDRINSTAEVGNIVYRIREDLGLSRAKLSASTGVSARSIYALEKGESENIGLDKLLKITNALGLALFIDLEERAAAQNPQPAAPSIPWDDLADIWKLDRGEAE